MARLRCPRCGTIVEQFGDAAPTCPTCGFGKHGSRTPEQAGLGPPKPADVVRFGRPGDRFPPKTAVGRPRRFLNAFLLSLITIPVAGIFYHHKAFRELDLQADRRPRVGWSVLSGLAWGLSVAGLVSLVVQLVVNPSSGLVWLWVGVFTSLLGLAQLFLIFHLAGGIERLHEDRATYGIEGGLRPGVVYLWSTLGLLVVVGPFLATEHVRRNVNRVQAAIHRHLHVALPEWAEQAYPPEPAPGSAPEGADGEEGQEGEGTEMEAEPPIDIGLGPTDPAEPMQAGAKGAH